jgi:hypothetical protein
VPATDPLATTNHSALDFLARRINYERTTAVP